MIPLTEGLVLTGGVSISSVIAAYIAIKVEVNKMKTDIEYIKKELAEEKKTVKDNYDSINSKLDIVIGSITDMRLLQKEQEIRQSELEKNQNK